MEYMFKVLFPEVLVKIFMDVHKCSYDAAEEEMLNVQMDVDAPLGRGWSSDDQMTNIAHTVPSVSIQYMVYTV